MAYLEELKDIIQPKLSEKDVKILPKTGSLRLVKDMQVVMTINDKGDYVELEVGGKVYKYDKWYTKPKHLAVVILRQFGFEVAPESM